ncbi:hypothetical protein ACQKP3_14100 [Vibrio sp. DNB22_10_4]
MREVMSRLVTAKPKLEAISVSLQILAILVAATWALSVFIFTVIPSMKTNVDSDVSIEGQWFEPKKSCLYKITVQLENQSIRSADIGNVEVLAYWGDYPELKEKETYTYIQYEPNENQFLYLKASESEFNLKSLSNDKLMPSEVILDTIDIFALPNPNGYVYVKALVWINDHKSTLRKSAAWIPSCINPSQP